MAYVRCIDSHSRDCAGNCYDPATQSPTSTLDCNGTCGGTWEKDCNGTCYNPAAGPPPMIKDCNGICGGSTAVDCNGACGGGAYHDCDGICGGPKIYDCGGVCYDPGSGPPPNVPDCAGTCNGTTYLDCLGVCGGDAFTDCGGNCVTPTCNAYKREVSRYKPRRTVIRSKNSQSTGYSRRTNTIVEMERNGYYGNIDIYSKNKNKTIFLPK